ncbi:hypothetical protein [Geopseudomonas aromaticivorans]
MRRIKSKERAHGLRYCTFCKPTRVNAVYREMYWGATKHPSLACEEHKEQLVDGPYKPDPNAAARSRDDTPDDSEAWAGIQRYYGV